MAISSRNSSNWILGLKVLVTSSAIFSVSVILKLFVPVFMQFLISEVPMIWSSVLSWLRPPYLYVVINGIIITIAASSRFSQKIDESSSESAAVPLKVPPPEDSRLAYSVSNEFDSVILKSPMEIRSEFGGVTSYGAAMMKNRNDVQSVYSVLEKKFDEEEVVNVKSFVPVSEVVEEADPFVISRSTWTPTKRDSTAIPKENTFWMEKPPVSVRFGHRKTVKASPEAGKPLGVSKPKRHDTLESTWKTITDGRPIPLARHLKKSDTWETHGRHHHTAGVQEQQPHSPKMMKSETFKDRNTNPLSPSPGSGKLKKEPSLSHDELNRRVEAFINKFNEEMRMQRQESLNQYKQMVDRR
ncbi:hypothetical protein ACHQM5_002932 [Ranunculus cassubicifolius]